MLSQGMVLLATALVQGQAISLLASAACCLSEANSGPKAGFSVVYGLRPVPGMVEVVVR